MGFQAGYNKGAIWRLATAGAGTTLRITDHSWAEAVDKLDVTHTGTGGLQALLAGIFRGQGTVKANYDTDRMPHATAPGIRAGLRGELQLDLGGADPFIIPAMITKVNYQSQVQGKVEYSFDVEFDFNAIADGAAAYSYPA